MIKAVDLTKKYESKTAIDKINVEFSDGAIYGLVGSNGSGKSTLLRLISGVYYPDSGSLLIDEAPVFDNPAIKEQIFYLPDRPYFFKKSNLNEMARFFEGMYSTFSRERFNRLKEVFPISTTDKIDNMSKGMQRQAALMLALSVNPRYLLLDEAFDGLDPVMRNVLKNLLIDGIENGNMTAIIASHNLRELEDLCDHILLIHEGHLVASGELDTVRSKIHKLQVAFKEELPEGALDTLNILKTDKTGSLIQMVIRGELEEIMAVINSFEPIFCEVISPSLEEMFIYEMEVEGYDIDNILN